MIPSDIVVSLNVVIQVLVIEDDFDVFKVKGSVNHILKLIA